MSDIHYTIGEFAAKIEHLVKTTDEIKDKTDQTHDAVIELRSSVKSAHKRIDGNDEMLKKHSSKLTGWQSLRDKRAGAVYVIAGAIGFLGAKLDNLVTYIAKLWGH